MKKIILLNILFFITTCFFAQAPANDACSGALNLGTLPTPANCGSGVQSGASTVIATTNVNATPENPYLTLAGCGMASPANSVWYTFVAPAKGFGVNIGVSGGGSALANPNIALWNGSCSALVGQGCIVGSSGAATLSIQSGIVPGDTYFIQVSGNTGQSGPFNLSANAFQDCADCNKASEITVSPLPVNGSYDPGQSVTFCYKITSWAQVNNNWLHGVQFSPGAGWDLTTLTTSPPSPQYVSAGNWAYYPSGVTSSATGTTWPAGFYFDDCNNGCGTPGDHWGDGSGMSGAIKGPWTFCWTLKVKNACTPGVSLSMVVNTSGDGESSGYINTGCSADNPTTFNAIMACCPPTVAGTSVICNGGATGSATATPVGSNGPYTYSWSPSGGTAAIASGLTAGIYTVTATDIDLCAKSATIAILQPPALGATVTPVNASCSTTGSITTVVSGGTPAYTFTWTGPSSYSSNTQSPTGLSAGTYTLNMKDKNGCPLTRTVSITQTETVTSTFTGAGTQCLLGNSFTFTNTGSSGTGINHSYTFLPTTGAPAASPTSTVGNYGPVSFTAPGSYTVSHTVTNGICVNTTTAIVIINPNPALSLSPTNPTCGNANGIIVINDLSTPAGQGPFTFASTAGTISGQTITAVPAGVVTVTMTNTFGCKATATTTLTTPPFPTAIATATTNAFCGNANGTLSFTASPGTAPYTYSVNNVTSTSPTSSLVAGTYTVKVKDANGCTFSVTAIISNIPGPTAIAGTTTQASCNTNNGTYTVTGVTGGTATYSFAVDGGALTTSSVTTGLSAATHTITVKDVNGCLFSTTFIIGTASGPSSFTVATTNASCGSANGTATVTGVTGGTPTYSFSFDGGAFGTGTTTSGLTATTHTVVVKDANSCTITATYSVAANLPPTVAVTSSLNILCNGASTGSIGVTPTGGTSPYTYTLTSPTQTNSTGSFTGLPAGNYSITVRDNAGCTATVSATLTQPTVLTGTTSSIPVNCFGNSTGTVSAGGSGGTAPYTYLWSLGSSTLATTGGAAAGTYTVTIKDANLCTITRTVTVTQPASLTLTSTLTPATCGNANGSGTVTVGGGTTPYTYNWSNGDLTNVLTAASAGNYTITAQDFNGCVITKTVAITNIPGPTAITGTTTLAGCGLNNGTYNVTSVTGGTPAYSYSVDAVATVSLTSGLAAGTHSITVKDFNGCLFSTTFNINTASGPTTASIVTTNASCGTANGTATVVSVTGGLASYQYSFDGGAFGSATTTSGLAAGTHTVTIKDANSCTLTVTYTEFNNSGPTASVTNSVNILCNGNSTGSFTVTPSGGTSPYTYTLTTPTQTNTTGIFTGLPAGSYNVTVSDNLGCTATASVTLTQPTAVTLTVTSLPVSCFGTSTGTVSASGSGGTGTLTYLWPALGSSTLATVNNVAAGTYSVTQTDANGCAITQSVTVTQPTSLTLTSTLTPATCGNANGSGTVTVGGGTPAYTYNWSNGGITSVLSGASAGTYTLNVTDFKGCILTRTVTITNIPGPTAITGTTTLAGCGLANGTYNVTGVTGGTAAYSFSVDAVATVSLTSGLLAGSHTIAVSDFNGCLFSTTFNIGTTAGPTSATITSSNASCGSANGTATVTGVTGGSPTYQYSFNGGAFAIGTTTTGLIAGTHTVTIKDANSCTLTVTYAVLNNGTPTASILSTTNTSCFGGTNGGFTIAGSGGSGAPFTYTLTSPFQSNGTGIFTGLTAGTYSVITKDNAGCTASNTVALSEPTLLTVTPSSLPVKCFGTATGTINLSGSGGTPTYSYNLNSGAYQTSSVFTNQFAAFYTMGIKDAKGCTATQTVQVTQPTALTINVSTQNANCTAANGIASSTVTGGSPIYTYSWTGGGGAGSVSNGLVGGTYTVTATDANGCVISSPAVIGITPGGTAAITASSNITCNGANDGSLTAGMTGGTSPFTFSWSPSGQTNAVATGLAPGSHTCVVTDFYGCKANASATLTQPTVLTAIMNSNNVKCYGTATGTVSAAGSGGTSPYTYLWPTIPSTLATVPNVALGNYTCNITDANGCTIASSITVTQPTSITLTSTVTAANCNQANGSATVIASGGAPGAYTYTWSSGSNAASQSSLLAGTYTIQVQDANNCIEVVSATIPNTAGPVISIASQTNVSCFGGCNGIATTTVTGGVTPYTYSWSNGNVSSIAPNLCAQIYTVSVTDNAGCVSSTSVIITQPTALTVGIVANNPKCFGATNGYGVGAALGGTPNYTYSWSGSGGSSATSNPLGAGGYNLLVTDGNGCTVSSSMTLVNPPAMAASITSTDVTCFGLCNGIATATSTNGIGAVGYYWVGGASPISAQTASGLCAGTYTMVATDQNTCTASAIITIIQPPVLTASISSTGSVTCNGGSNGFAVVSPSGGTTSYTYAWTGVASSSGNSTNANNLPAGTYSVTVTDAKGCVATANATIIEPAPLSTTLTTTNPLCNNSLDGTGNVSFSGGVGIPTFLWQPLLQSGSSVNTLGSGSQTVTITYNSSCTSSLTFTLNNPIALTAVVSSTNSNCGQNNGKSCAVVSGGTGALSYQWSNGPTTLCNNNIPAGAYNFAVTDINGCVANASGLVNDIAGPVVSITSFTNVSCFGLLNGGAAASISGGVPNYTVSWSGTQAAQNTSTLTSNFGDGLHNITVQDAAGCIGTASVNITQPASFVSAIASSTNVTCFGLSNGGATIVLSGGTAPYSYSWLPTSQSNSVLINVPANTYTGNITDAKGCIASSSVVISQPQALAFNTPIVTNIKCFGANNGQISVGAVNGTPGYNYSWTPAQGNTGTIGSLSAGGYSLVVTDANSCSINTNFLITEPSILTSSYTSTPAKCDLPNGSATVTVGGGTPSYTLNWNTAPAQQGFIASNMAPGSNWQCVITDFNGCSITQTVNVNSAPSPIFSNYAFTPPSCFGMSNGDITLNYTLGTSPYTVNWSSPISQTTTSSALTQSVAGVAQGAYTATLTDVNGCVTSQQIFVTEPGKLILVVSPDVLICYGQSTQISASGQSGSPAYSYTWSPNPFVGGGPHTVNPTVTTSYIVTVGDSKGCVSSPGAIKVNVAPQLLIDGYAVTKCEGQTETLTPIITSPGRGAPYNFAWSNGVVSNSVTTSSISVTASLPTPNQYTVTIDDGCTLPGSSAVFTVNVNALPVISFTANPLMGCAPLTVTLSGTSSGTDNQFFWQEAGLTGNPQVVTYSDTGKQTVTLIVTNTLTGCSSSLSKKDYIEVYPQPVASFYADPSSASILDPNFNFINTSQGAVSYFWDFGDPAAINGSNNSSVVNPSHGYSYVGEYAVNLLAISPKGCKAVARILIEVTPDFALYIPNAFTPDENGRNDFFQPMGVGIDESNYRLDIFDRWGENIFTSNDFRKGWDGTVKGGSKLAPQGVYIYKLYVTDLQGGKHPFVGHVTVIRKSE